MNKKQKTLFERAIKLGFDKPEAAFHVRFHEISLGKMLDSKEKKKRNDCWKPSAEEIVQAGKTLDEVIKRIEK